MKKKEKRPDWRIRAIESLDKISPHIHTRLSTNDLQELFTIAYSFSEEQQEQQCLDSKEIKDDEYSNYNVILENQTLSTTKLLTATVSFLSRIHSTTVPHHLQIVVPGARSTASANPQQIYEISVWERGLSILFIQEDLDIAFFEYSTSKEPLIIDVYAVPPNEFQDPYWKSALSELSSSDDKLIKIQKSMLKGVFSNNLKYVAVTWNGEGGYATQFSYGSDPRAMADSVVASFWEDKKCISITDLDQKLNEYNWEKLQ